MTVILLTSVHFFCVSCKYQLSNSLIDGFITQDLLLFSVDVPCFLLPHKMALKSDAVFEKISTRLETVHKEPRTVEHVFQFNITSGGAVVKTWSK